MLQDPLQPGGKCQDGDRDAGQNGDQKAGIYRLKRGGDVESQERLPERPARARANAHHELFIDSENKGHGSAGNARDDIGASHGKAARGQTQVLFQGSFGCEIDRGLRIRVVCRRAMLRRGMGIRGHRRASEQIPSEPYIVMGVSLLGILLPIGPNGSSAMFFPVTSGSPAGWARLKLPICRLLRVVECK